MKKPKAGVSWKDAQKQGFSQVFGCPGIAFSRKGRHYNSALVEVNDDGSPIERPAEDVAGEPMAIGDAADVIVAADAGADADPGAAVATVADADAEADAGGNDDEAGAAAAATSEAKTVDSAEVIPLRAKLNEAQAELDAWVKVNDANTPAGKKDYAKLYGRVRRAKDAIVKAGGKVE